MDRQDIYKKYLKIRSFGLKKRISLYERLQAFLTAGIDIVQSLTSIRDRYAERKDRRALILTYWLETMGRGQRFEAAVKEWVPASEHMLISAGERGEGLIKGLGEATTMSMAASRTKTAIIAGTLYPVALIGMMIGMLIMFQEKMVPVFSTLKPVQTWPDSGKMLYELSWFFYHRLWLVLLIIGVGVGAVLGTMGRWHGRVRSFFDKIPPWSVYRGYQASSFMIGLASLMRAGIPNYDALSMMRRTATPWMTKHLERMQAAMALGGANQGAALNTGLLDKETAGDVQDYSRLGSFQNAIYTLGARALESGVKAIESRMAIIKNVLLVGVVCTVGWIYMTSYLLQADIAGSQNNPASRITRSP